MADHCFYEHCVIFSTRTGDAQTSFKSHNIDTMAKLRASEMRFLKQAVEPFFSSLRTLNEIDFPEEMFRVLNIRNFDCKQKIICEIEQFVASKGVAGFIVNFFRYATIYRHFYVLNLQPSISVSIPFPLQEDPTKC